MSAIQVRSECRASTVGVGNGMNTTHNTDPFLNSGSLASLWLTASEVRKRQEECGTPAEPLGPGLTGLGTEKRGITGRGVGDSFTGFYSGAKLPAPPHTPDHSGLPLSCLPFHRPLKLHKGAVPPSAPATAHTHCFSHKAFSSYTHPHKHGIHVCMSIQHTHTCKHMHAHTSTLLPQGTDCSPCLGHLPR